MTEKSKTPHTITATFGAASLLVDLLTQAGWYTKLTEGFAGGELADAIQLADFAAKPATELVIAEGESEATWQRRLHAGKEAWKAWAKDSWTRQFSDRDRDVARACVKKFASEGKLPMTSHAIALIRALGLDAGE